MTILVYDNGKIIVDKADPIEGQNFNGLIACLANPQDGDTLVYNATSGLWQAGNPLPLNLTDLADGDTLAYDETSGKWINVHAEAAGGE